jgi:hypothetical protein
MYSKTKLHAGLMSNCDVCTPNRERKRRKFKKERIGPDVLSRVKKQMGEEIGEDILTNDQNFALLQKYGVVSPRIDRKVTKPSWKGEKQWNQETQQWYLATKGLVPLIQKPFRKAPTRLPQPSNNSNRNVRPQRSQNSRGSNNSRRSEGSISR